MGYGYTCRKTLEETKALWAEGLLTKWEFCERVAKAIREDDGIPF